MQMQFPFFPASTKLINPTLGFYENEGLVYYLHNGSPIFCHKKEDITAYRYICGNLVFNKLCTAVDLAKALGVNRRNIERYAASIRENGPGHYLNKKDRRGQCHTMTPEILKEAQELLDAGKSQLKIAQTLGVSESSIRGHITKGNLKKKL
jgi:biotin operon repressor